MRGVLIHLSLMKRQCVKAALKLCLRLTVFLQVSSKGTLEKIYCFLPCFFSTVILLAHLSYICICIISTVCQAYQNYLHKSGSSSKLHIGDQGLCQTQSPHGLLAGKETWYGNINPHGSVRETNCILGSFQSS